MKIRKKRKRKRRLMYVAMTQAMDQLHMSMARTRRGAGRDMECDKSRFLADIPEEWIIREEIGKRIALP